MDRGKKLAGWASGSTSSSFATTNHLSTKESLVPSLCWGLSTPFHKYDNVCGSGLRSEVAKRGGGDTGTSAAAIDKEIARNLYPPEGLERDGPISLLLLLADVPASPCRRASIWAPSRSQQT